MAIVTHVNRNNSGIIRTTDSSSISRRSNGTCTSANLFDDDCEDEALINTNVPKDPSSSEDSTRTRKGSERSLCKINTINCFNAIEKSSSSCSKCRYHPNPIVADIESSVHQERKIRRRSSLKSSTNNANLRRCNSSASFLSETSSVGSVSFGSVEVHEFELELGGSTLPSSGPSVQLSWKRSSYKRHDSIEDLEDVIDEEKGSRIGGTKDRSTYHVPEQQRIDRLLDMGYTRQQIKSSIRENVVERSRRRRSAKEPIKIKYWRRSDSNNSNNRTSATSNEDHNGSRRKLCRFLKGIKSLTTKK